MSEIWSQITFKHWKESNVDDHIIYPTIANIIKYSTSHSREYGAEWIGFFFLFFLAGTPDIALALPQHVITLLPRISKDFAYEGRHWLPKSLSFTIKEEKRKRITNTFETSRNKNITLVKYNILQIVQIESIDILKFDHLEINQACL